MSTGLDGIAAVVTGSTRGLGAAIARALVAHGAQVVVNGTDATRCQALARELGCCVVVGSVADEEVADALIAACVDAHGHLDFVVNNAGTARDGMLGRLTAEAFDEVVAVHLRGTWLVCRAAAAAMRGTGGSILNVVSGTAVYGNVGQSNYAAAKGGVLALTRALSLELARARIRVNAISPVALTDMTSRLVAFAGDRADLSRYLGDPADVATAVVAFAAPDAPPLTGQLIGFDGRRLTVWSHPQILHETVADGPWSAEAINATLAGGVQSELHPDGLGREVLALMGVA
jgi:NAD(P)-dependent dehydrogenase (short-subunit alcohol dehydrogenase family)